MKLQDRFFPRVWDGDKFWYPVISELGITYECPDLPFEEENLRDLDWAFDWRFYDPEDTTYQDTDLKFVNIVEGCTGKRDKNDHLIYEGDIVKVNNAICEVRYDAETCAYKPYLLNGGTMSVDMRSDDVEVIGNIHMDEYKHIGDKGE